MADGQEINVVFATERKVQRFYGNLRLMVNRTAVVYERVKLGVMPFLDSHNPEKPVGVVRSVRLDASTRAASARVRMDDSPEAEEVVRKMRSGVQRGISPGVNVLKMERSKLKADTTDDDENDTMTFNATRWEVVELSSISTPANPEASVKLSFEGEDGELFSGDAIIDDRRAFREWMQQNGNQPLGADTAPPITLTNSEVQDMEPEELKRMMGDVVGAAVKPLSDQIGAVGKTANDALAAATATPPTPAPVAVLEPAKPAGLSDEQRKQVERAEVIELGIKYGQIKAATDHEGDVESFREKLLTLRFQPNPVSRQPVDPDQRFNMGAYVKHLVAPTNSLLQRDAAYEIKTTQENDLGQNMPLGEFSGGHPIPMEALNYTPRELERREDLVVTTTSAAGAITTQADVGRAYQWLVDQAMIAGYCTIIPGLTGNLQFPVATGGATVGYNAEGTRQAESTPTMGTVNLTPKTLSAYTQLTRLSVLQTGGWLDGFIRQMLSIQFGEQIDAGILDGSGSNSVTGLQRIATGTAWNQVQLQAAYSSIAWSTFTGLESLIRAGKHIDKGGRIFLLGTDAFEAAQTTSKDTGSGLFIIEPGSVLTIDQVRPGVRNSIDGYPAIPTTLTNDPDDVIFGDFNDCYVGFWDGLIIRVDDLDAVNVKLSFAQFWDVDFGRASGFAKTTAS